MKLAVIVFIVLAFPAAYAQPAYCPDCVTGTVTGIIDGDTLDIDHVRVRLALVDTPEMGAPGYAEAAAFTSSMCPVGSEATYNPDDGQPDGSHGRIIAEVFCDMGSLNENLVEGGHAVTLGHLCGISEFSSGSWSGCDSAYPGSTQAPAEPYTTVRIPPPVILFALIASAVAIPVIVMLYRLFR